MKQLTIFLVCCLLNVSAFAQTNYEKDLISSINALSEQIDNHPNVEDFYVKRSEAIFLLNAIKPWQTWVAFTLADAISDVNNALRLNPDDASLYSLRAEYKRDIHLDLRGAISDMKTAIELQPDNPQWYFQRASYRKLIYGCVDYKQCADMDDKRCMELMREVCVKEEPLIQ